MLCNPAIYLLCTGVWKFRHSTCWCRTNFYYYFLFVANEFMELRMDFFRTILCDYAIFILLFY
jgi:hypothetical protein